MGQTDYDLQQRTQVEMIANVFYNMLNQLGASEHDQRFTEMSTQIKHMMQTRQFDTLAGLKVANPKANVINLLKVVDLAPEDEA